MLKPFARSFFVLLALSFSACSVSTPRLESHLQENALEKKSRQYSSTESTSSGSISFIWPLNDGRVSQEFRRPVGRKRAHRGVDIAAPKGTKVMASHSGIVLYSGRRFRGFGRLVIIESWDGKWATFYSHLNRSFVKNGQKVKQEQVIGTVGKTGRATGYHLHFEVRKHNEAINPLLVLP